jgi:DNA-binding NtrC family response regulator/tetratricopeptide (TPR) repeat protein
VAAGGAASRLRHVALEPPPETPLAPLAEASVTDRQRIGVLLQGAALLAHLDHAGCRLDGGWGATRLTAEGLLRTGRLRAGRSRALPQERMRNLAARLFGGDGEVAGRGEGRRAARALLAGWAQSLAPVAADELVEQVVEAAPFLWEPRFGAARRALAGEHRRGASSHLWAAGPGRWRMRLLAAAADLPALTLLVGGVGARSLWRGDGGGDPRALVEADRPRAAVAAWAARPPSDDDERRALARAWFSLGRFERAHAALAGCADPAAAVLRARCQLLLGRPGAARRSLRALAAAELPADLLVDLAEVAVRAFASSGDAASARDWVARAVAAVDGGRTPAAARAHLLAAGAAWDRGENEEMARRLQRARPLLDDPGLAWQWHQMRGLAALSAGEGNEATASLHRALAGRRRHLRRFEAAALWNDLGVARGRSGDLAGAERAFLHAQRLFRGCDGPRATTLGLVNLAEIRLRRGRPAGVREILERVSAENRAAGNVRGGVFDDALWARFELLHGRPEVALVHCREALARLARHRLDVHRDALRVLAARALGWLGRAEEAAAELAAAPDAAPSVLEPEELPPLWALAGERDRALAAAAGTPLEALWRCLLAGEPPAAAGWEALARLEPFRAARVVYDGELIAPDVAPGEWLRRAVATFRRLGAGSLAGRLEARDAGPWAALADYLSAPRGEGAALAALFAAAGYREARLTWTSLDEARVLVAGAGGGQRLSAPAAGGELLLAAPALDAPLRALFRLALRELPARAATPSPARADGIVGDAPELTAALVRVERLAPGELPILIRGESGTGKELVARRVHRLSARREGPFVAINCAALSESLLLSDLFGHVRGAFTGADRDRAGVFETAQGGTVFLDEIGDLPASAQGMLLRVLQEGEVRRVGESLARRVDVRVVAASHRDLTAMAREGSYRQDLYYRLRGALVTLPPLRARGRDVLLLAEHLLARRSPTAGAPPPRLSAAAQARLLAHPWPGNVRELDNVLATAAALAIGGVIEPDHLELPAAADASVADYHREVDALRRRLVGDALAATDGNRAAAARRLGVTRQALSYLVHRLQLD